MQIMLLMFRDVDTGIIMCVVFENHEVDVPYKFAR